VRTPIGPRWLTWVILAFGVLEIPWVVYLVFFQTRTGTAEHTHLAALSLAGGGAVLAVWSATLLWRSHRLAAVVAVMTGTWMGANLFFALTLSAVPVILATIPGLVVAAIAARGVLRDPERSPARWQPAVLVLVAGVLVARLALTLTATGTSMAADHLRLLVVLYDTAEVVALLGLGLSLRAGRAPAAIAFGSMGIVLFFLDAFVNVVVVPGGPAFVAALFYAVVGEIPSIAMCTGAVVLAMRRWTEVAPDPSVGAKMGA
jgi:hypothetical protein